jgi:hypothetical protein
MKVKLTQTMSGTRDGQPWPPSGSEVDLPDSEAVALLQNGGARAVDGRQSDVEKRLAAANVDPSLDEATAQQVRTSTTTNERAARSKRAHEPLNLGAADDLQPAEDDNGPRLPEVNAKVSAKVEDPAQPTQTEDGPSGEKTRPVRAK